MTTKRSKASLKGLKVLELAWLYMGPITTRFLSDNGATVIKIESPSRPDESRGFAPFIDNKAGMNRSHIYANYNAGKLSMALNLSRPEGIEIAKKLANWADILVETFRPGVLARMGLRYDELCKSNPGLIMVSASMQGQTGPFAKQPTLGTFFQATLGFADTIGWQDRIPAIPPTPYPDFITPWFIFMSIMAALDYRRRNKGEGRYIDISQMETSAQFLGVPLLEWQSNERITSRQGNQSAEIAPHGAYRCAGNERYCAIAVFTDEEWRSFCQVVGEEKWIRDPRFITRQMRKEHEGELDELIEGWTRTRPAEEVMALLQSAGVPSGVVKNAEDLWQDPQLKHRGHFQLLEHPEGGSYPCEVSSFRLSDSPARPPETFPILGQDNYYICSQILGMSDEQFANLQSAGVLGGTG